MQVMILKRQSSRAMLLAILLSLCGCADLREATPAQIRHLVIVKTVERSPEQFWVAPELQIRRYRLRFSGYDTVYYYLYAVKTTPDAAEIQLGLKIDANYGGVLRHYDQAILPGGVYPTQNLQHDVVRCQLFSNMADACLYRDRGNIMLGSAVLEASRVSGLSLALSSANHQNYENIDLPAAYIDGFLQAIQNP